MNRTELIEAISTDTGLTRRHAEIALDALVYEITAGVHGGDPVRITGFGTFKLRVRRARRGRNPQTGAPVAIGASKGIGFTPGQQLRTDLNSATAPAKPEPIPAAKMAAAEKTAVSKASGRKRMVLKRTAAKKTAARKRPAKKTAAKKTVARKRPAKKTAAKKTVARKRPAKKAAVKKAVARTP